MNGLVDSLVNLQTPLLKTKVIGGKNKFHENCLVAAKIILGQLKSLKKRGQGNNSNQCSHIRILIWPSILVF